jgi:hypothetical protein
MAYTNIDDPSAYFQTALYTGNNTANHAITNDGNSDLQPDMLWIKSRDAAHSHWLVDSSRGVTKGFFVDATDAEKTSLATRDVASFDTDGFTVGVPYQSSSTNSNASTKVAWQWKANGGTTSTNTAGTINTTIQTNTTAGFSICTHDGNGTAGATFGHGLGVKPDFIIAKRRDGITNWRCYHSDLGATKTILLNTTDASFDSSDSWNNTEPTSTLVSVGSGSRTNATGSPILFYIFASKQGYSKFGKYTGNGNADGTFIYTGFKPAFVLVKNYSNSGYDWRLVDSARNTFNLTDLLLMPNNDSAEFDGSTHAQNIGIDFLSNGFKCRSGQGAFNLNGGSYIYMAFAENPFTTSTGIPTTAR